MAGAGAKLFTSGSVLTADQVNTFLMDQSIMRFTSTTTRDAAFGGAGEPTLSEGMFAYTTDTNTLWLYNGSSWVNLLGSDIGEQQLSNRNVVINGAMQVAQRGTSTAGITASAYYTADRFATANTTLGTWTQSIEADAPTGSGFRNSLKMLCTTADASPAAADGLRIDQNIEGQNLQQFLKGTSSAKPFSVSFWVKSNVTGTYIVWLFDEDNSRQVSASYTISASATWEKKTITLPADTTGAFNNDNGRSLYLSFWLGAGSNFTSGTLATTWASYTAANAAVGQTNLGAATSNYWQVTGVQLEASSVATPFEFEDFGVTLAKCQRYYQKSYAYATAPASAGGLQPGLVFAGSYNAATQGSTIGWIPFQVAMRAAPTVTIYGYSPATAGVVSNVQGTNLAAGSGTAQFISEYGVNVYNNSGGSITPNLGGYMFHFVASIEL